MLRTSVCLLAGARLGAAQGPLSNDVAVLLAFKAHGNNAQATNPSYHSYANPRPGELALDTWVSGGDPCDDGTYDQIWAGWHRVKCCEAYDGTTCTGSNAHRVTYLNLDNTDVDGDVSGLGGLAQLTYLDLHGTAVDGDVSGLGELAQLTHLHLGGTAVDGDVSGLGGLAQLTYLILDYTAVDGDVSGLGGLAQLTHLSLDYTDVDGDVSGLGGLAQLTYLKLHVRGCYGDSSLLPSSFPTFGFFFCSRSHDACPAGRTPVSSSETYVGINACACCSGTQKLLDSETGACVDPGA